MTWVILRQNMETSPDGSKRVSSYGMLSRPVPLVGRPLIVGVSTTISRERSFIISMTKSLCLFSSAVWLRHLQGSVANQNGRLVHPIRPR